MYETMLALVREKMKTIEQISLEVDSYNNEWKELSAMEDSLLRLIKLEKGRE